VRSISWTQSLTSRIHLPPFLFFLLYLGLLSFSQSSDLIRGSLYPLVYALISSQTYQPTLLSSTFSDIFLQLIQSVQADEQPSEEQRASTSRDPSPSGIDTEQGISSALKDVILDIIWAIDSEIDARKDLAATVQTSTLLSVKEGTSTQGSLEEQSKSAKVSLAEVIRSFLVSRMQFA
jgi:hypothetical protein